MKWHEVISLDAPLRGARVRPLRTLADWQSLLDWRRTSALAEGRRAGEQALSEQLLRQRTELKDLHGGVLEGLREAVAQVRKETETELIELAFEVAQKLVAELPISREQVAANVRAALAQADEATEFLVYLHPDDLALVQKHAADWLGPEFSGCTVHLHASPEVSRGGSLVRTRFGVVDTRRETRLARLREALGA